MKRKLINSQLSNFKTYEMYKRQLLTLAENVFEGYSFYIPNKPDRLLEATYGSDYMQLPPVEQRKTHAKKIGVNF